MQRYLTLLILLSCVVTSTYAADSKPTENLVDKGKSEKITPAAKKEPFQKILTEAEKAADEQTKQEDKKK